MRYLFQKELPLTIKVSLLMAILTFHLLIRPSFTSIQQVERLSSPATRNFARLVDPFTGTGLQKGATFGGGHTFPGADVPFGLVQWSPDTVNNIPGGYDYDDHRIKGFSLMHLDGAGCTAYGNLPFMPYVGAITSSPARNPSHYSATFSHAKETAYAGYYKVKLNNGVTTELTATRHSGAARFTYPPGSTATLLANVSGSQNGVLNAQATVSGNTISGSATGGYFCSRRISYTVYFWASFSQPFASYGTWKNNTVTPGGATAKSKSATVNPPVGEVDAASKLLPGVSAAANQHPDSTVTGPGSGVYVTFDTSKKTTIGERVGISFVSIANAQANVNQEDASGGFNRVLSQAVQTWNKRLGEIQVNGGTSTQTSTFYTAMYHALLQPNVFSDVNGQYIGFDGRIYTVAPGHAQYANFSGWDIYRSEAQLLAFLAPDEASDIAQSMVNDYTQSNQLPKWTLANSETYVMSGDPADAVIADIYAFGGRNFDTQTALSAMIQQATQTNGIRYGLNDLLTRGYLLAGSDSSGATTLEYNTDDFAIGMFAQMLGDTKSYQTFVKRAQNWHNLFNASNKHLEPRNQNGTFSPSYNLTSGNDWAEGDGAQYDWMVPFNLRGLFDAMGGNAAVVQRLNRFFTQLNGGKNSPYAFLGNEPTIGTPWEYDYAGTPYKTQQVVRAIENKLWYPGPQGLAGNDDLGTMSAWYVWAALGMFPETPGTANLVLASPLFPSITITRPGRQTIEIRAPGASATMYYVQRLVVNGVTSSQPWLPPSFIAHSGTLDYTLSKTANTNWGAKASDAPPSYAE